jgi:cation diffusion facilitator family transporter
VSLVVASLVFALKLVAWALTGSSAVLSDALESIVNVAAAAFVLFAARFAAEPPDREHPYGHGKIEHISAGFEGGLVAVAAVVIVLGAAVTAWRGPELRSIDLGLGVTALAGGVNLVLGAWLVARGKALRAPSLVADGHHVLSDVWTTVGVLVGLGLVRLTGWVWFDPLTAAAVGLFIAWTGLRLFRQAAGALLDQSDPELIQRLMVAFDAARSPGIIDLHDVRTIDAGGRVHIDAHAHVPEYWTVDVAHDASKRLEADLLARAGLNGDLALHLDPCGRAFCARCDAVACPIRVEAYRSP